MYFTLFHQAFCWNVLDHIDTCTCIVQTKHIQLTLSWYIFVLLLPLVSDLFFLFNIFCHITLVTCISIDIYFFKITATKDTGPFKGSEGRRFFHIEASQKTVGSKARLISNIQYSGNLKVKVKSNWSVTENSIQY